MADEPPLAERDAWRKCGEQDEEGEQHIEQILLRVGVADSEIRQYVQPPVPAVRHAAVQLGSVARGAAEATRRERDWPMRQHRPGASFQQT